MSPQCDKQTPPIKCKTTLSNAMTSQFPLQSLTLKVRVNYSQANQKWDQEVENLHNILYKTILGLTIEQTFHIYVQKELTSDYRRHVDTRQDNVKNII